MIPDAASAKLSGMDEKAIRRAALITVRRAILERFPPGPERTRFRVSCLRVATLSRFADAAHRVLAIRMRAADIGHRSGQVRRQNCSREAEILGDVEG